MRQGLIHRNAVAYFSFLFAKHDLCIQTLSKQNKLVLLKYGTILIICKVTITVAFPKFLFIVKHKLSTEPHGASFSKLFLPYNKILV